MKKAEPENLIEALTALPESAWIKPRVLTADEKAMVAKLDLWARRAFGVSIGRFHNQAGVDVPNFDSIEGLVSFGIKHGVRLTQEGAAIADAAHLWKGHTQANTAGRGTAPGRKPGPSADVQKLRDKLYDARQVHILKAGAYTAEAWETWIPKFIKGLRPKSLLNVKIYYENRGTFTAKELYAKQWEALYKREHARRHKNAG